MLIQLVSWIISIILMFMAVSMFFTSGSSCPASSAPFFSSGL